MDVAIGLWGVDMAAQEEWQFQRSGCHYFIWEARKRGIKVTLPPESDLLRPPPLYGFAEADPHHVKLLVRKAEISQRLAACEQAMEAHGAERMFLRGALDDLEYHLKTWVSDRTAVDLAYGGPAGRPMSAGPAASVAEVASGGVAEASAVTGFDAKREPNGHWTITPSVAQAAGETGSAAPGATE